MTVLVLQQSDEMVTTEVDLRTHVRVQILLTGQDLLIQGLIRPIVHVHRIPDLRIQDRPIADPVIRDHRIAGQAFRDLLLHPEADRSQEEVVHEEEDADSIQF